MANAGVLDVDIVIGASPAVVTMRSQFGDCEGDAPVEEPPLEESPNT